MNKLIILLLLGILGLANAQHKDVFLLIGQSNMAGRGDFKSAADSVLLNKVFLLNDLGKFEAAKNPLNRYSTIRKVCEPELQRVGLGASFANAMSAFLKDSVYLIVNARGGTPILKFLKGGDNGYYETILNRTVNALKKNKHLRLRAILWHQGESDAENPEFYLKQLQSMVNSLRTDLKMPNLPFIAGELGEWNPHYKAIGKIIQTIPATIENTYVVSTEGLKNRDEYHFDTPSYSELGKRFAEVCKAVVYEGKK